MYQDPQEKGRGPAARVYRTAVLLIAVLLLIGTAVGSTAAFLVTKTEPVVEDFAYAQVSCQVTDTMGVKTPAPPGLHPGELRCQLAAGRGRKHCGCCAGGLQL